MIKKICSLILLILLHISLKSQNLIINGDFESYSSCPYSSGQVATFAGIPGLLNSWDSPNTGSPDYLNVCGSGPAAVPTNLGGNQTPNSGDGYCGLVIKSSGQTIEFREYLQSQILTPLVVGDTYELSMFISLGDNSRYASSAIGGLFSTAPTTTTDPFSIPLVPQAQNPSSNMITDKDGWELVTLQFVADSAYNYITIGNFYDDANTPAVALGAGKGAPTYFYIDDVSLVSLAPLNVIGDTTICAGDSIALTAINDISYTWVDSSDKDIILSNDATLIVAPPTTTTYLIYGTKDTISFKVNVYNQPVIDLGNDTTLCFGESISLDATTLNSSYLWQDGSTNSTLLAEQEGTYTVQVEVNNCFAEDEITVQYEDCVLDIEIALEMPNVITPNSDGFNDLLVPKVSKGIASMNTTIYNRWGNKIFETDKLFIEWNSNDAIDGTYFWVVNYVDVNGVENSQNGTLLIMNK